MTPTSVKTLLIRQIRKASRLDRWKLKKPFEEFSKGFFHNDAFNGRILNRHRTSSLSNLWSDRVFCNIQDRQHS